MSWFRRRPRAADADGGTDETAGGAPDAQGPAAAVGPGGPGDADDAPEGAADAGSAGGAGAPRGGGDATDAGEPAPDRSGGPFDASEVADDVQRIDLGALRVPAAAGAELRLEVEDKSQRVVSATVALHGSTLQLQAFAAPRTEGVWAGIRAEIATQVTKQGGSVEETAGPFGRELLARLPARTADGRTGHRPARFIGVDGPRWFLRGVVSGSAAAEPAAAADLEAVLRGIVVVRGTEAMAPRDLLALTLPPDATRAAGAPGAAGAAGAAPVAPGDGTPDEPGEGAAPERPRLAPPERGPEITERR